MSVFDQVFTIIIGIEGGYANNPNDPGGETKFGISKRSYPELDIRNLTLEQAKAIYQRDYWNAIRGDELPPTLALIVFDSAVNNGTITAIHFLQAALNVTQDGKIGPHTMAGIESFRGKGYKLQAEFEARRMFYQSNLSNWRTFALSWCRRMALIPYLTGSLTT